jgi:hypothetical protein
MNTTTDLVPQSATLPASSESLCAVLKPPTSHGRTGKVARLPKAIRDQINVSLQDGVPYLKIIELLGPHGEGLTENNLSNWKSGGYLDWLREQQFAKIIHSKHELAESIVARSPNDNAAAQAILKVIATNLCEFLVETDPLTLRDSLLSDSDKFARFVNSMVRLAEGGIKCGIYKSSAALSKSPNRAPPLKNPASARRPSRPPKKNSDCSNQSHLLSPILTYPDQFQPQTIL